MAELTLEQQVARLTAIEDIKQMKSQYCYYADHGYDPDGMASLFVEDAIWDGGDFGRYEGKAAIREFFVGIKDEIVFAIHPVMNPIITLDGDTANAKWCLIMWCTMIVNRHSILTPNRRAKLTPLSDTAEVVPVVNRGDPRGFV